jgi:hypothetical protein
VWLKALRIVAESFAHCGQERRGWGVAYLNTASQRITACPLRRLKENRMEVLIPAAGTTAAVFIILCYLDIYKVLGYHWMFDIAFTVVLAMFFAGTYSGVLVAIASGLMLSILLVITKWLIGYKRVVGWKRMRPIWHYFEE